MRLDAGNIIPDGKLLDGIAKGDKDAFTEFYQRHNRALFAFLVKLVRDREMAEEVLSETMLDVWRQGWNPWYHNFDIKMSKGKPVKLHLEWKPAGGMVAITTSNFIFCFFISLIAYLYQPLYSSI